VGIRVRIVAAALLAAFAAQAIVGMLPLSATWDEVTHLPSGYTYWTTGRVELNKQHPPLVKLLCAAPLLAVAPRADFLNPNLLRTPGYEWAYGSQFLYRNDADRLLLLGRLPVVGIGVLLGLYVFLWSRRLWGDAGGLLSLGLYAFCPNLLGHTHLVTMDVGLACFAAMALYHLWRDVAEPSPWHRLAAGAAIGAALATKFSALVFLAVVGVLAAARALEAGPRRDVLSRAAARFGVVLAAAATVVWAAYLFPGRPGFYLEGLRSLHQDHQVGFQHYLLGDFRERFWSYFLVALGAKTPVPTLVAWAAAIALALRGRRRSAVDESFLWFPALVFLGVTTAFADDLGVRYVLPVVPFVMVAAGRVGPWLAGRRVRLAAAAPLLLWLVVGTLRISPDHLAYFNELAGGPENGWKVLDDSNIDWGQDLKRLKPWMDANGVHTISLLYTGNASPEYHGIRYRVVPPEEFRGTPQPGWYAVSVQALVRGRMWERTRGWRSDWMARYRPVDRIGYSIYIFRFGGGRNGAPSDYRTAGTSAPL
jgi:hypothetical protein